MAVERIDTWPEGGLLHHWFVRYNPMYFFSALCVLGGMYLVTRDLPDWHAGQIVLAGVVQLYEGLVLLGAALLWRVARQRRPAVLLGLVAAVFLLDPTLRTDGLSMLGRWGGLLSGVAWLLVVAKVAALRFAFDLRAPASAFALPIAASGVIVAVPHVIAAGLVDTALVLTAAAWAGAAIAGIAIWQRPSVRCTGARDRWGSTVLRRAVRVVPLVWAAIYAGHLLAWTGIHDVPVRMAMLVPYLVLVPIAARRELAIWISTGAVLGAGLLDPSALSVTALALGVVLAWIGQRRGLPALYVAAMLCAWLALWTVELRSHALPEPNLLLNLLAATALAVLGWRYRLLTALPAAAVCLAPGAGELLPHSAFQWGGTLLALGFAALVGGFAFDWSRPRGDPGDAAG